VHGLYSLTSGWQIRPHGAEKDGTIEKEITMSAHGNATVWGTHIGIGRATDTKGWYQQLKEWWATQKAARYEARLATLKAHWDVRREAVRLLRADAAVDMVAPAHAFSITTALCDLGS
jgi:hypothetical protein